MKDTIYLEDEQSFLKEIMETLNPARLESGLNVISADSAKRCFRFINKFRKEQRRLNDKP